MLAYLYVYNTVILVYMFILYNLSAEYKENI